MHRLSLAPLLLFAALSSCQTTTMDTVQEPQWLDFSGATPMVVSRSKASAWRGTTDPATGEYSEYDPDNPVTDYDRAASADSPCTTSVSDATALLIYTENDDHAWVPWLNVFVQGGWIPTREQIDTANWQAPTRWTVASDDLILMNSAVDASAGLDAGDFAPVDLAPGNYVVEFALFEEEFGIVHRVRAAD